MKLPPCSRCGGKPQERLFRSTCEYDIICECEPGIYRMVATQGKTALSAKRDARKMWRAINQKGGE